MAINSLFVIVTAG